MKTNPADLFRLAAGKNADGSDAWKEFLDAVKAFEAETHDDAIQKALTAIDGYMPINAQDMMTRYRRGYQETKSGCRQAVEGCRRGGTR